MVLDIAHNPRIAELLGRVQHALREMKQRESDATARAEAEARALSLYGELGRYVHWLSRQEPETLARIEQEARRWALQVDAEVAAYRTGDGEAEAELLDGIDELTSEHTASELARVELTGDSRSLSGRFDVRDLGEDAGLPELMDVEAVPVSELDALPEVPDDALEMAEAEPIEGDEVEPFEESDAFEFTDAEPFEAEEDSGGDFGSVEDAPAVAVAVRTGSVEVLPPEAVAANPSPTDAGGKGARAGEDDWLGQLRSLLSSLGAPNAVPDPGPARDELMRAVSRVTTNLETKWSVYPGAVQQALLGLVGARARRLEAAEPQHAEIRLALGRMTRFAEERDLLRVPSLRATPSDRDWFADERRYWAVLHAGL